MSILDSTENIMDLYMYAAGDTGTPQSWNRWVCISMVAAALSDRAWFQKLQHKVLAPNLYVMLIGASGVGKGNAIDFGLQFKHERMNMLYGAATSKALLDRMCAPTQPGDIPNSKMFIVQDELADAVGHSNVASAYIKSMTAWYSAGNGEIEDNTRMHGRKVLEERICMNWLSGTTVEWLQEAMDYRAMMSGGFGRVCTIPGAYNYDKRVYRPAPIRDYNIIVDYLRGRFEELTFLEGEFEMLPAAEERDEQWFHDRAAPREGMEPFWMREPALMLKLAMIMSACDSMDRIIRVSHILKAQELLKEVRDYMPKVIEQSAKGGLATATDRAMNFIGEAKRGRTRTELSRFLGRWGIKASEVSQIVETLLEQERIETTRRMNKTIYTAKIAPAIYWESLVGSLD